MTIPGTGTLRIRRYEPADCGAVRALHDEALDDIENVYLTAGGEFLAGVLRRVSEGAVQLTLMRVAPRLQGRGMGCKAAEPGYEILRPDTTVQQVAPQRLYEKNGCREVGRGMVGSFRCVYHERDLHAR